MFCGDQSDYLKLMLHTTDSCLLTGPEQYRMIHINPEIQYPDKQQGTILHEVSMTERAINCVQVHGHVVVKMEARR